jgi:hypothetical protein
MLAALGGTGMREGITVQVSDADRTRLVAIVADRNSPQKHVWRAQIVLLTADGVGTNAIMRRTGKSKVTAPPAEVTHWTATMMAKALGISVSSVQRIWRAHGLQPHRVRQFKLSCDPRFGANLRDVVCLSLRSEPTSNRQGYTLTTGSGCLTIGVHLRCAACKSCHR